MATVADGETVRSEPWVFHLLAERTALERMLAETPEADVIDRSSLAARLRTVEESIRRERLREEVEEPDGELLGARRLP